MWLMIKDKFNLHDNDMVARKVVFKQFAYQYRNWRHRLHTRYYKPYASMEEAILNKPPDVDKDRRELLCKQFDDEKFKARCVQNKLNRSKQKIDKHGSGSMAFARREFMLTNKQTSTRATMLELRKETHWSKKKNDWVCEESKAVHEKAIKTIDTLRSEGKVVDEEEVFGDLLSQHGSYICGRGHGLKPSERAKITIELKDQQMAEMKEQHENVIAAIKKEAREAVEEVKAEMLTQKTEMLTQKTEMENKMNTLVEMVTNLTENAQVTKKKRK